MNYYRQISIGSSAKKITKFMLIIAVLLIANNTIKAQDCIIAAGGFGDNGNDLLSYSVGQVFYSTNTYSDFSVIEGVHQPYDISTIFTSNDLLKTEIIINAYPNPTSDELNIYIANYENNKMTLQFFDALGKLIETRSILSDKTSINMRDLPASSYFVRIFENNKELKVFRVIKLM